MIIQHGGINRRTIEVWLERGYDRRSVDLMVAETDGRPVKVATLTKGKLDLKVLDKRLQHTLNLALIGKHIETRLEGRVITEDELWETV